MKNTYKKILTVFIVASILAGAYFWGGNYSKDDPAYAQSQTERPTVIDVPNETPEPTDPVPEGHPEPVEPQDVTVTEKSYSATMSVRCDTILDNMNLLSEEKWELVPEDAVIYATQTISFYEGESAFNVLHRAMKQAGIHFEFVNTPIYNSAYIEGINNIYAFDVGELSGWMYKVNGWFPSYGCSRYTLQEGDVIEWVYTCDLGDDVGGDIRQLVEQ